MAQKTNTPFVVLGSALGGAVIYASISKIFSRLKRQDPETNHDVAHGIIWQTIGGALKSSMLYIGDRLKLYEALRECCAAEGSSVTAVELSQITGLNQRWIREWLAQQAAMGILVLLPGDGDNDESLEYRLPKATGEVLADKSSKEYDIAMVQCVPSLVNRAKTMLPEAFRTGIGRPYDELEVAEGINRHHKVHVREVLLPKVIPAVAGGKALQMLHDGCMVADLGCGGGNILTCLAKAFPASTFHGFDVSRVALDVASQQIVLEQLRNVFLQNSNEPLQSLGDKENFYDLITTFDVLHDSPDPVDLVAQVKRALKPGGFWLLADIPSHPSVRENMANLPDASLEWAFSVCLCMSCSLSTKNGAGLGTLGFSVPVAKKMIKDGGFNDIDVLLETEITRWFLVQ